MGIIDPHYQPFGSPDIKTIDAAVYVKPIATRRMDEDLQLPAKHVRELFGRIAKCVSSNVRMKWKNHRWPEYQSEQNGGNPYRSLNLSQHAADCAVIVSRSVSDVIIEIPALLSSRHRLSHVFLVGLEESDTRAIPEAIHTLNKAPVFSTRPVDSDILIPCFGEDESRIEDNGSISQGLISLHSLPSIPKKHTQLRDHIALVLALKFQDFRRTDIDEDGNTIERELFEDWPGFLNEKDVHGEDWKPEGWDDEDNLGEPDY